MRRKITLIVIIVTAFYSLTFSQEKEDVIVKKIVQGGLVSDFLLPLNQLMDLAVVNSPLLKYYNSDIIIRELKIKAEKRTWMSALGVEASAKYGLFDNLIVTEDLGTETSTSTTEQTRYSLGVYLKMPLNILIDKSKVKQARVELDMVRYQKESSERELRQLVIVQYNNILKANKSLSIRSKSVEMSNLHMIRTEKDFSNGKIDITEYSRIHGMSVSAELEFENLKIELKTAVQILQEIVGAIVTL